jgi:hypothetical protein
VPSPEEKEEKKKQKWEAQHRRPQERQLYDEKAVKAFLLGHIKDPCREKLRDAIGKLVDSYSKSIVKASSGPMHLARETYRDVTHMETVEMPDESFDMTLIRYLMLGTEKAQKENELVHALNENFAEFCFEGTRDGGDSDIYDYGAMKYLTNLKNRLTTNLERFMTRAVFALYPGQSRNGKWTIISGITRDRKREDEVEFVDKKASNESTNEASVIRAVIQEHHADLGWRIQQTRYQS